MKRLLSLLLVMGMVGCGGGNEDPPAGEAALPATPNKPQAKVDKPFVQVDEPFVQTVDGSKLVERDGLIYEGDSETPFTGFVVYKYENGQKLEEVTYKDGKYEGLRTQWHENGKKASEVTFKDGKFEGLCTEWHENGQKYAESTYKAGKSEGLVTFWHKNGQKEAEETYKAGKLVSGTDVMWDEEGNEIKE